MKMIVNWFEVMGQDAAKTQAFYSQVFDWQFKAPPHAPTYGVTPPSDGGVGGGVGQVQTGQAPYATFYVEVDDVQGAIERTLAAGGSVVTPPTALPTVTFALIKDLDGNLIGIGKANPPE